MKYKCIWEKNDVELGMFIINDYSPDPVNHPGEAIEHVQRLGILDGDDETSWAIIDLVSCGYHLVEDFEALLVILNRGKRPLTGEELTAILSELDDNQG